MNCLGHSPVSSDTALVGDYVYTECRPIRSRVNKATEPSLNSFASVHDAEISKRIFSSTIRGNYALSLKNGVSQTYVCLFYTLLEVYIVL